MTTQRVRLCQRSPALGDVEANEATVGAAMDRAASDGVDLLVFPELFLTGYHLGDDAGRLTDAAAAALDRLTDRCRDVCVVVGAPVEADGTRYNSAAVLDDGERLGSYHKIHLYGDEPAWFEPGDDLPVFDTSAGRLGIGICFDVEFPEVARGLSLAGAETLVTISANMHPYGRDHATFHAARAMENARPHVLCNRVGEEHGVDFAGASGVLDSRGRRVVAAGEDLSMEVTADLTPGMRGAAETMHYLDERRPGAYRKE